MANQPPAYAVVLITAKDAEEAEKIGKALVKRRLAACVNIVPQVSSLFWWKDKLENTKESLLIVKTKESLVPDIVKATRKLHSYSYPGNHRAAHHRRERGLPGLD